jgi:hypothetical protein
VGTASATPRKVALKIHRKNAVKMTNTSRAIMYYTKTIELSYTKTIELSPALDIRPIPALYWRGQMYAQRGNVALARAEFERALATDEPMTWFPEEREFAERYLAEHTAGAAGGRGQRERNP